jgi:DAACS family dicarboxylate/amino acid:cation (Na+ or H+) symporter
VAIVTALLRATITGRSGARLLWFLATNTLVAISIGLLVANVLRPGDGAGLPPPSEQQKQELEAKRKFDPVHDVLLRAVPRSFVDPFKDNEIIPLIVVAIGTGVALRRIRQRGDLWASRCDAALGVFETIFEVVLEILHWVFVLVPIAVFAIVAATVAGHGLGPLLSMGHFVIAVILALALQACFYLSRLRLGSWVRPGRFLRGGSEALAVAFSTASSTATLPVTFRCATDRIGVRPSSASLGVMVGGSMNNDGTALYEAMAALFIAQALGLSFTLGEQAVVMMMAVVASVGAAGIPEAGLVTMIAVFTAVKLPIEFIPLLLPLDWLLDRCRTAINVMGDLAVTSLLDGRTPPENAPTAPTG